MALFLVTLPLCLLYLTNGELQYPVGDIRNCPTNQLQNPDATLLRMNVVPGLGFDNLRNLDVGRVYNITYSSCQISDDGLYILPNDIYLVPVLNSQVDFSAEIYDHFDNWKSSTSASINIEAKYSSSFSQISGKFSTDYQTTKTKMVNSNSQAVRVGLRHHLYSVHINPDAQLHSSFKSRVLDIAANIQNNNTEVAHYLTELLVRDYGTHVVTSAEAGASLYQTTFIDKAYSEQTESSQLNISATASASFFSSFSINTNFQFSHSHLDEQGYSKSTTHSHTTTHGGPPFKLSNFSYGDWENGILNNLVAIDRRGQPLYTAISSVNLPELPDVLLLQTIQYIYKAISKYYKINTHYGCTDSGSPNFNFQANVDDDSCKMTRQNYTFGGIFQTCENALSDFDVCESALQTNPLTQDYSCPTGYRPILLHTGTLTQTTTIDVCKDHCGFLHISCHKVCQKRDIIIYGTYRAYWCAFPPNKTVGSDTGYLFGGIYTSKEQNPITGARSCPMSFYPLHFGEDMEVCVSNDVQGISYSLPFGGFESCTMGNPLASSSSQFENGIYPHRCPCQFNQFLATVDQGCVINYCSEVLAFKTQIPHPPRLPPYRVKASLSVNVSNTLVITGPYGAVWVKDSSNGKWTRYTKGDYANGDDYIQSLYDKSVIPTDTTTDDGSKGIFAGVIVGTIISTLIAVAFVAFIVIGIMKYRKRRKMKKSERYMDIEDSFERSSADNIDHGTSRNSELIQELKVRIQK